MNRDGVVLVVNNEATIRHLVISEYLEISYVRYGRTTQNLHLLVQNSQLKSSANVFVIFAEFRLISTPLRVNIIIIIFLVC